MTSPHIIVIGGGIAGLTAATYAARTGARVTLFERASEAGGRARTIEEKGFLYNMGPHALYQGGAADEVLADLAVPISHRPAPIGGGAVAVRNGRRYTMPAGVRSLITTGLLGIRAKADAATAFHAMRHQDTTNLQHTTLADWIASHTSTVAARQLMEATFRVSTYSNAPNHLSAGAALDHFRSSGVGPVRYLDGGWRTLVAGLRSAATAAGAVIETGTRVDRLLHSGQVSGVRLADGATLAADAVIIATEPSSVTSLLPELPTLHARLRRLIPAQAACLDVALERLPVAKRTFGLGIDCPYYLSVHSHSAKLAPDGMALVSVAKYLPVAEENDPVADERELEAWLDLVQPGWRDVLVDRRYLPSMTVMHAVATADGGGLAGRPTATEPGIDGVYLAGDWVGGEGILADVAFASGREAARLAAATPVRELAAV